MSPKVLEWPYFLNEKSDYVSSNSNSVDTYKYDLTIPGTAKPTTEEMDRSKMFTLQIILA